MDTNSPNPVVAEIPASDGGTIRIYANGLVDAIDGKLYSVSPGFRSVDEFDSWLADETAREDERKRIAEAADAYGESRDGSMRNADGRDFPARKVPGPTAAAVSVLETVHESHLRGSGLSLSHTETATLWAEIVRRTMADSPENGGTPLEFRIELAENADKRRGGRA